MEPAFTPILVDRQNSGRYSRRPELPWRYFICCVKISFLNTSPGLPDEQPHVQLSAKRDRAPGRSLKKVQRSICKKNRPVFTRELACRSSSAQMTKGFSLAHSRVSCVQKILRWASTPQASTCWLLQPFHGTRKSCFP